MIFLIMITDAGVYNTIHSQNHVNSEQRCELLFQEVLKSFNKKFPGFFNFRKKINSPLLSTLILAAMTSH